MEKISIPRPFWMKRLIIALVLAPVVAVLFSGCAEYQLGDVKPSVYAGVETIHVPPFKNNTLEPRLSSLVTNAVLKQIQVDGTYKVGSSRNCDAILVGTIEDIHKRQLRSVRTDTLRTQELTLRMHVHYYLEDARTGRKIGNLVMPEDPKYRQDTNDVYRAPNGHIYGETIQNVDDSFQVGERNGMARVAEDLAAKLVAELANGW